MDGAQPGFDAMQLEDLQGFVRDWLRHAGRTQADLRRALRAESIRMPVLLEELQRILRRHGLPGLVDRLCEIESHWQAEEPGRLPDDDPDHPRNAGSFGQLDLLLQEIRGEVQP